MKTNRNCTVLVIYLILTKFREKSSAIFRDFERKLKLECIKFRDFLRIFDVKVALTSALRDN